LAVPRSIPMSLDNQPKSPLNMKFTFRLVANALSSLSEARPGCDPHSTMRASAITTG
jgi:hypothetical protein